MERRHDREKQSLNPLSGVTLLWFSLPPHPDLGAAWCLVFFSGFFASLVGDIPPALQPKLLHVLQEREFERLGSSQTNQVNVRLVAASHRIVLSGRNRSGRVGGAPNGKRPTSIFGIQDDDSVVVEQES